MLMSSQADADLIARSWANSQPSGSWECLTGSKESWAQDSLCQSTSEEKGQPDMRSCHLG